MSECHGADVPVDRSSGLRGREGPTLPEAAERG